MAHKKAGRQRQERPRFISQRLGDEAGDGQFVTARSIIVHHGA